MTQALLGHNHELRPSTGIISEKSAISEELLAYIKDQVVTVRCGTTVLKRQLRYVKKVEIQDRLLYNLIQAFTLEANGYGAAHECAILVQHRLKCGKVAVRINDKAQLELGVFVTDRSRASCLAADGAFVDVIAVDATHSTNRWGLYVVLLTGSGPFGHNLHLGAFVMNDESVLSYEWCFREFNKLVPGFLQRVKVVITDGLPAYNDVVQPTLFPNAHHVRCLWHLEQQLAREFASSLGVHFQPWWTRFKAALNIYDESEYRSAMVKLASDLESSMRAIGRDPARISAAAVKLVDILVHEKKFALCFLKRLPTRGARFSTHSKLARSHMSMDVIL